MADLLRLVGSNILFTSNERWLGLRNWHLILASSPSVVITGAISEVKFEGGSAKVTSCLFVIHMSESRD